MEINIEIDTVMENECSQNEDLLLKLFPTTNKNEFKYFDEIEFKKKCPDFKYQPVILEKKNRIIAIGDLHGDYERTIDSLILAKVMDKQNNWIGGDTVVVQVGDQIDRCRPFDYKCNHSSATINDEDSDIKILKLFNNLHKQAIKKNGAVISLLGNHELMNVLGNLNYVSYLGLESFKDYVDPNNPNLKFNSGKDGRKYAFSVGNEYAKLLACSRVPSVIIGEYLFVHAGIVPEFLDKAHIYDKEDLYKINLGLRSWLLGIIDKNYVSHIVDSFEYSMFWNRVLGAIPSNIPVKNSKICRNYLKKVLNILKVGKMIIGHTPQFFMNKDGINQTCDGKLWRIDVGISDAFSKFDNEFENNQFGRKVMDLRKVQVLEIKNDKIKIIS